MPGIAIGPHLTAPLMLAQTGGQCISRGFQNGVDHDRSQCAAPQPLDKAKGIHVTNAETFEAQPEIGEKIQDRLSKRPGRSAYVSKVRHGILLCLLKNRGDDVFAPTKVVLQRRDGYTGRRHQLAIGSVHCVGLRQALRHPLQDLAAPGVMVTTASAARATHEFLTLRFRRPIWSSLIGMLDVAMVEWHKRTIKRSFIGRPT